MLRIFKHYIPKSLLMLGVAEAAILLLAIYVGVAVRFQTSTVETPADSSPLFLKALLFCLVMLTSMTAMGLYQRHLRHGLRGMFLRIALAFASGFVGMILLFYLFPTVFMGRGAFALGFVTALLGVIGARLVYLKLVHRDNIKRQILVIGTGEKAALIDETLKRRTDRGGFRVVGYVAQNGEEHVVNASSVLFPDVPLVDFCARLDIDEIVVAATDRRKGFPVEEILDCKMSGIDVVDLITFFERQAGRVMLKLLQPSWLIFSDGFGGGMARSAFKRAFDIAASLGLLAIAWPFMLIAIVCIFAEDRGPIFYKQVRVGQNWKLFQVLKFRSMRVDAEKNGAQWATKNDSRITRVGNVIRKLRIDELPQLLNVLRGDMSFVGPRPERPQFVEEFSKAIPFYAERHRVKPGVTGWAQICYPYGASEKDTMEKLQYDLYYVKNYSLFLDIAILFQTAEVILWGKGAR